MIPRLTCRVGRGVVRAELRRGAEVRWAADAQWETPTQLAGAIAELAAYAALPAWWRRVMVVLEEDLIQRRVLADLPAVGGGALTQLVALAPQRYFRGAAPGLVTSARWVGVRKDRRAVAVAVERGVVEALVRGAREAGLRLGGIDTASGEGGPPLSLLPPDESLRRELDRARRTTWALRVAGAAWLVLFVALWARDALALRRIDARYAELRGPLEAVLAAEAGIDSLGRMVARLDQEAATEGVVPATLFRVATALPDSAFLTQLQVDSAGFGLLAGGARRPAAVLAAMEGRAGIRAPRFAGRTTRDLVAGRAVERFAIGFGGKEGTP